MIDYKKLWHVLDVDVSNALNPNFDAEKFWAESGISHNSAAIWSFTGDEMLKFLNQEWIEYMHRSGMPFISFLLFYRKPYLVYPEVHVDLTWAHTPQNIYGLNWVLSPNDDSFMTWYDVPIETGTLSTTPAGTDYLYWKLKDVEDKEIARHTIGNKLTMVSTGVAHNVIVNAQPRWLISLRFEPNPAITDWNSAVDYYNNTLNLIKHDTN